MESDTSKNRTALSENLNKKLLSYAAAAGAAGVGILGAVQPAEAEVVYTPANTPILVNHPLPLDLNNDGLVDFTLSNNYRAAAKPLSCTVCSFFEHASLKVGPAQSANFIWGTSSVGSGHATKARRRKRETKTLEVPVPLPWGVVVGKGPGRTFKAEEMVMASTSASYFFGGAYSTRQYGAWGRGRKFTGPYLGFKFTVDGQTHYGWARVAVQIKVPLEITATLTGYAYETVPNRPIATGFTKGSLDEAAGMETQAKSQPSGPATLGQLAHGVGSIAAWRSGE